MPSFAETMAFLIEKEGGNEAEIARQLGVKSDGTPKFSSQLLGQYRDGKAGKKRLNLDFVQSWKARYGDDIQRLMEEGFQNERRNERNTSNLDERGQSTDLYQVIVDTMQHILQQNTNLINQRQSDIEKLHTDKEKLYKEKEWMYSHIDDLTSKINTSKDSK